MIRQFVVLGIAVALTACGSDSKNNSGNAAQNTPLSYKSLSVTNNTTPITIFAERSVGDEYIKHAANVAANYLDSDNDGNWDNQAVANRMANLSAYGSTLFIFKKQYNNSEFRAALKAFPKDVQAAFFNDNVSQTLYESEMILCTNKTSYQSCFPIGRTQRDGSYEEILHIITHTGYSQVHNELSELETKNLTFTAADQKKYINVAMDLARGDLTDTAIAASNPKFNNTANSRDFTNANACTSNRDPDTTMVEFDCLWSEDNKDNGIFTYPSGATFSYYDESADYATMVTEYTYWTINAALGMLEYLDGQRNYSDEYKCLKIDSFDAGKVCANDTAIEALYGAGAKAGSLNTSANPYKLPTRIPFGDYAPNGTKKVWSIKQ